MLWLNNPSDSALPLHMNCSSFEPFCAKWPSGWTALKRFSRISFFLWISNKTIIPGKNFFALWSNLRWVLLKRLVNFSVNFYRWKFLQSKFQKNYLFHTGSSFGNNTWPSCYYSSPIPLCIATTARPWKTTCCYGVKPFVCLQTDLSTKEMCKNSEPVMIAMHWHVLSTT